MEPNNWPQQSPDNNRKKVSPAVLIFIGLQVLLIILVWITLLRIDSDNITEENPSYDKRTPEFTIKDLSNKASFLTQSDITDIQKKVFKIVSKNADNIDTNNVEAIIRDGSVFLHDFGNGVQYLFTTIDIPSLEQSYDIYYSPNAVVDPEESTFVLCLDEDEEIMYEDYECRNTDDEAVRNRILAAYLEHFKYKLFTPSYYPDDDPKTINIGALVNYNYTEEEKAGYINEVRASVESLGFSPDKYSYHVATVSESDYEN